MVHLMTKFGLQTLRLSFFYLTTLAVGVRIRQMAECEQQKQLSFLVSLPRPSIERFL